MVADTGRGLSSYQLAHVFDEYSSYGEEKKIRKAQVLGFL